MDITTWSETALAALEAVARGTVSFTSDEVWAELDRFDVPMPDEPRAMGSVMRAAVKSGFVFPTDLTRPSTREVTAVGSKAHGRKVAVVESRVWDRTDTRVHEALWPPTGVEPVTVEAEAKPRRERTWRCTTCDTPAAEPPFVGLDPAFGHGRCADCGTVQPMRRS